MNTQDPNYGQRSEDGRYWWDGDAWELISNEPYSQPIPQQEKSNKLTKVILISVGGLLGVLVLAGIAGSIVGTEDESTAGSTSSSNWPPKDTPAAPAPDPTPDSQASDFECAMFFKDEVASVLKGTTTLLNEGQVYFDTGDLYGAIDVAPRMTLDWTSASREFASLEPKAEAACEGSNIGPEMEETIPHLEQYASDWATAWEYVASGDLEIAVTYAQSANGELQQANDHLQTVSEYLG